MSENKHTEYNFDDLTIWSTPLPDVKFAILPAVSDRPNPRISGSLLFVSVFSPGAVCALEVESGKVVWRRELPYLGGSAVELSGGRLFTHTSQTLYAMDPESGAIEWEFCPHGTECESIYSDPVVDDGRLFIGDRAGFLHCLDVEDGRTIWKQQTPGAHSDVNATGIVHGGLVITANNSGLALAYDVADGRAVWQAKLDGPCTKHLFVLRDQLFVATNSLYMLKPQTGEMQMQLNWPDHVIHFAAVTAEDVALLRSLDWKERAQPPDSELVLYGQDRLVRKAGCSKHAWAMRLGQQTHLLYVSGLCGLNIVNADRGAWLFNLRSSGAGSSHCGLPDVTGDRIYAVNEGGVARALRHP